MIELEKIALKNIVVHKNTSFELQPGITVIRGDNGAGKSLLASCLPNVFDGCPPLLKKKDAKVLHKENSAIGIKYKYNGKQYRVVQSSKKSSLTYKIEEDGKDLDPRTVSIAKDYLEKIFPISNAQYYSLVHLTAYRPSTLLSGSGPQRKEFFEELFHLDINEVIADKLKEEFSKLKRWRDEKEILEEQLKSLTYIENIDSLKKEFSLKNQEYKKLKSQYNEYSNNIQNIAAVETYKKQIQTKYSPQELQERISRAKEKIKSLEDQLTNLKVNINLYKKNQENIKKKEELENKLAKYPANLESADVIKELYSNTKNEAENRVQKIKEIREKNSFYEKFKSLEEKIAENIKILTYEDYLKECSVAENNILNKENLIHKLNTLVGKAVCPTCQQSLNEEDIKVLISNCENEILTSKKVLENKTLNMEYLKNKDLNLEFQDESEILKELEELKEKMAALKEKHSLASEKEKITLQLKSFPEILNMEEPKESEIEEIEEKIAKGKHAVEIYNSDLRVKNELKKLESENIDLMDENEIKLAMQDLSPKIEVLNEERMNLNSKIKIGESQNNTYKEKENRIKEIEVLLVDIPIYEALIKAYGAKGIRIDQIKYLAEMFCTNLNKYANLVFNKKIKFSVNVDSTNFNIYAERNGGEVSDVCMLSGSESRCFCLLCAISLLPFIPEKYRTDFIILDEMEAGIKDEGRKLLTQGFFKALQNIVPKIVIITPMAQNEYYIEADNEYYIKLENNVSIMKKVK